MNVIVRYNTGAIKGEGTYVRIFPLRTPAYEVKPWEGTGGHGGGDRLLLDDLFLPKKPQDKYLRAADQRGGAYSMLTGAAADKSILTGKTVIIEDLVSGIGMPDIRRCRLITIRCRCRRDGRSVNQFAFRR